MKYFVIGGAGYIGSHFVAEAIRQGHECQVYDSLELGHKSAVHPEAALLIGDIHDTDYLAKTIDSFSPDAIFHYAAYALVPESVEDPCRYYHNNVGGVISLVDAMRLVSYKNPLIFSSTCAVYGTPNSLPVSSDMTKAPESPYGHSKLFAEQVLRDAAAVDRFSVMMLRYFNACGADVSGTIGENHDPETHLIPNIIKAALNNTTVSIYGDDFDTPDGTCIRDYIHVTDLAESHILAANFLMNPRHQGLNYSINIGTGTGYSNLDVLRMVEEVLGAKIRYEIVPRRTGDATALYADSSEAEELIGFEAKHSSLRNIVETAYNWHKTLEARSAK